MYVRAKVIKGQTYYYLVRGERHGTKVLQKVVRYLGKKRPRRKALGAAPRAKLVFDYDDSRAMGGGEPFAAIKDGRRHVGAIFAADEVDSSANVKQVYVRRADGYLIYNRQTRTAIFDSRAEAEKAFEDWYRRNKASRPS